MNHKLLLFSLIGLPLTLSAADLITVIPMEADDFGRITESVKGDRLNVNGRHTTENVPGAVGDALRFDGYSTYVTGALTTPMPEGAATVSVWVAPETYPIIKHDEATSEKAGMAGTIDHKAKQGWGFSLGQHGAYSFDVYAGGGWLVNVEADDILPAYEWSHLVAVLDPAQQKVTLYRNGKKVGEESGNILKSFDNASSNITIGKTPGSSVGGAFLLDTFNGLIDDIDIYDGALTEEEIAAFKPENAADLSIPQSRFAKDLMRPHFHGMPGANWTNETHGMTFSDGKFHVFFQKNANGPYMSRLHWGHISSPNLYDWTEEKIAIAPGESFDIKGVWSGCVFTDDEITGGKPNAIYTGVDYVKAVMVQAEPLDDGLIEWKKGNSPIINGKPFGLSDDFRDPYFFRNGDNAYLIVGTSKDHKGAATLHKYNKATETWSNDGSIFYQAKDTGLEGTFWEMPNVTKMDNGKWLFTVTPQGQSIGVNTIYWVGDIAADGTFVPDDETPRQVEMISRQGYGLLSPTIYQYDGKTLALGIVPDKISTDDNCKLGWAHLYSFPREWSLDNQGNLIQKPFAGLADLRSDIKFEESDFSLDGTLSLNPVEGRQIEVLARFEAGSGIFGLKFLKNASGAAVLTFNPATGELKLDASSLNRIVNDRGWYDGVYSFTLPEKPAAGSEITLNVFVDGSIVDIFLNNRYATSIRVFANDANASDVEAFAEGASVKVTTLDAWVLESENSAYNPGDAGVGEIVDNGYPFPDKVSVYSLSGTIVKQNVDRRNALDGLLPGAYIVGNRKVIVK